MRFARTVFGLAAVYGFLSLPPLYFLLARLGRDAPPAVTHPELYYGFLGLALLWQVIFVFIARDPIPHRSVMPVAILEKFAYSVPVVILYSLGKLHPNILRTALVDPVFAVLFIVAYFKTPDFASVKATG